MALDPGTPYELRDGSTVLIRPIDADDGAALAAAFERLSAESRYRRFFVPMARLSSSTLAYLTRVDHHDHEALVAVDPETREGVGVARFVRLEDRAAAETAVTVADAWQGRGLGTLLLELLAARAREERIERFTAVLLAHNDSMLDLLKRLGPTRLLDRAAGTVEIEAVLPADGVGAHLGGLMRVAGEQTPPPEPAPS
ncbi:MAG TPA: GNAT family N-acetyltransferase [Solirubrobacteraceae bacterium]